MSDIQKKTEKEEPIEKDEIPPDSDLRNQYIEDEENQEKNQNENNQISQNEEIRDFNDENEGNEEEMNQEEGYEYNVEEEGEENNIEGQEEENIEGQEEENNIEEHEFENNEEEQEIKENENIIEKQTEINKERQETNNQEKGPESQTGEREEIIFREQLIVDNPGGVDTRIEQNQIYIEENPEDVNIELNPNEIYYEENQNPDEKNIQPEKQIQYQYNIDNVVNENQKTTQVPEYQFKENENIYPTMSPEQITNLILQNQTANMTQEAQDYQYNVEQNQDFNITSQLAQPYEIPQNYQKMAFMEVTKISKKRDNQVNNLGEQNTITENQTNEITSPEIIFSFKDNMNNYETSYQDNTLNIKPADDITQPMKEDQYIQSGQVYDNSQPTTNLKEDIETQTQPQIVETQIGEAPEDQKVTDHYDNNQADQGDYSIHNEKENENFEPKDDLEGQAKLKEENETENKNPNILSFQNIASKIVETKDNIENEKLSEYVEIPRNEFIKNIEYETVVINKGMETGSYKFNEINEVLKDEKISAGKRLSEEEIEGEINKRASEQKEPKTNLDFRNKFFMLTEYDKNIANNNDNEKPHQKPEKPIINIQTADSPLDNYSKYLFEQINNIRADPKSFIGVIEDSKANIVKDKFGGFIYKDKINVALSQGEPVFNEAIEFLKKTEPMEKLEFSPDLTAELPKNEREIGDRFYLRKKVDQMVENGLIIKSYWKDIIKDPQINFLLMIVDDNGSNTGLKRSDILNPKLKYIGISSVQIKSKFVCYITLSYGLKKNVNN